MKLQKIALVLTLILYNSSAFSQGTNSVMKPSELARHVADIIVEDTQFQFEPALQELEQKRVLLLEFDVVKPGQIFYARTLIKAENVDEQDFGNQFAISHSAGSVEVQLNEKKIYSDNHNNEVLLSYNGYSLFEFQGRESVQIQNGRSPVLIKFKAEKPGKNRIYISFLRSDNGLPNKAIGFRSPSTHKDFSNYKYWWIGPFLNDDHDAHLMNPKLDENDLVAQNYVGRNGKPLRWDLPELHLIKDLPGNLGYQNWHYSSGVFLDAMKQAGDVFEELDYSKYIDRHLDFFLENRDQIKQMKEDYGIIEPVFGHYFRFSLLDDMGMQTVPYVNRLLSQDLMEKDSDEYALAEDVVNHIINHAARLPDGTFARFNPDSMVVWADDLYMGSIFLLKMTELTGNLSYRDEVINQVKLFDNHLKNEKTGLYWHGWFSRTEKPSSSKWGRANGWTMMAKAELLLSMPEDHPEFQNILDIFQEHAKALLKVQANDGRWHQVLDNPSTYLETSATAMFLRTFAMGVTEGWLNDSEFNASIEKAWYALTKQIDSEGNVTGIVRGTPIMFSDDEYANWSPRRNDPRGMGSVIYAAIAKEKYDQYRSK